MKCLLFCCLLAFSPVLCQAADAPAEMQTLFTKIIAGVEKNDIAPLLAEGDEKFQAALTPDAFHKGVGILTPRFQSGYETAYFGQLKKLGYDTYVWKLSFKDGGDDLLCILSVKNGKVGGFSIK